MTVLFISNGHGEDTVACSIIRELHRGDSRLEIAALPLVGTGDRYGEIGVDLREPPEGNLSHGFRPTMIELVSRLLRGEHLLLQNSQEVLLRSLAQEAVLAVAVGDFYPAHAARWAGLPYVFVGVNKSDYYREAGRRYLPWERSLLRGSIRSFVRDRPTAAALQRRGILNAVYVGNPMMDIEDDRPEGLEEKGSRVRIGMLPGSYEDLYLNMADMLDVARLLALRDPAIQCVMIVPKSVRGTSMHSCKIPPWNFEPRRFDGPATGCLGVWRRDVIAVPVVNTFSPSTVQSCDLVIGLAGTANEQAVGLGIPVVSFLSRGIQYRRGFARAQRDLLGDALAFVEGSPDAVVGQVLRILSMPSVYKRMSGIGCERMGLPGASQHIAGFIARHLRAREGKIRAMETGQGVER